MILSVRRGKKILGKLSEHIRVGDKPMVQISVVLVVLDEVYNYVSL